MRLIASAATYISFSYQSSCTHEFVKRRLFLPRSHTALVYFANGFSDPTQWCNCRRVMEGDEKGEPREMVRGTRRKRTFTRDGRRNALLHRVHHVGRRDSRRDDESFSPRVPTYECSRELQN